MWRIRLEELQEWWEAADSETRYAAIVVASGGISIGLSLLALLAPSDPVHRIRIENP